MGNTQEDRDKVELDALKHQQERMDARDKCSIDCSRIEQARRNVDVLNCFFNEKSPIKISSEAKKLAEEAMMANLAIMKSAQVRSEL